MMRTPTHRAFTMIELVVVLGIIAILVTLSITVGRQVTKGGEERITRDMIRVLDTTLTAWYADKESKFPAFLVADAGGGLTGNSDVEAQYPIIDGREKGSSSPGDTEPTLAAYLAIARDSASVDSTIKQQIDAKYIRRGVPLAWTFGTASYGGSSVSVTILDAWGNPIRFVHPAWHGGYGDFIDDSGPTAMPVGRPSRTLTKVPGHPDPLNYVRSFRSVVGAPGDADEGLCPGNRPYFYSAGRDQDAGTREDNIYTSPPSFPPETARIN